METKLIEAITFKESHEFKRRFNMIFFMTLTRKPRCVCKYIYDLITSHYNEIVIYITASGFNVVADLCKSSQKS